MKTKLVGSSFYFCSATLFFWLYSSFVLLSAQMYIALISAHALGLSGMHFFTCIKVQWNGEAQIVIK